MKRLKKALENKAEGLNTPVYWSLMCPYECPGLADIYGEEFDKLYEQYEKEGKYREQLDILKLWDHALDSQLEAGIPYIVYKDHALTTNQIRRILESIRSSNLCVEIM